jgi:hypothetical protein
MAIALSTWLNRVRQKIKKTRLHVSDAGLEADSEWLRSQGAGRRNVSCTSPILREAINEIWRPPRDLMDVI